MDAPFPHDQQPRTVLSLIDWGATCLAERLVDEPRLNAELLLCHALQCRRIDLYLRFDKPVSTDHLASFRSLLERRLNHEPLQYITAEAHFMGLRFQVDRRVLIPRQETEILVEQVLSYGKERPARALHVLDLGTGSGNIAVSIAKYLRGCSVASLDISGDALDVARANARLNGVENRITWMQADILTTVPGLEAWGGRCDVLVANPPYIPLAEHAGLQPEVRDHEPQTATTDRADGLSFYRRIAAIGKGLLKEDGALFVEIAYNQGPSVGGLFGEAGFPSPAEIVKDYDGNDRVVKVLLDRCAH